MSEKKSHDFRYIQIPVDLYLDEKISDGAKLLYGRIASFCGKDGKPCYASNSYFEEEGKSERSVTRYISELCEAGYVRREIERNDKQEIIKRQLFICEVSSKMAIPIDKNGDTPIDKNGVESITKDSITKENSQKINLLQKSISLWNSLGFVSFCYRLNSPKDIDRFFENINLSESEIEKSFENIKSANKAGLIDRHYFPTTFDNFILKGHLTKWQTPAKDKNVNEIRENQEDQWEKYCRKKEEDALKNKPQKEMRYKFYNLLGEGKEEEANELSKEYKILYGVEL